VIGDSLVAYLGGSRGSSGDVRQGSEVAVRWDGGSLTNRELDNLLMRRRIVNDFLQRVEFAGELAAVKGGVEPRALRVIRLLAPQTEQNVVATRLFADAARDAGMHVSDEAIVRYLDELGRGNVTREDMRAMINRPGGARVAINDIMDALREEMLAHNYLASHQYAFLTATPQQRFDDWLRVNDRVVVEAAAIPVESFVAEVPNPTEPELTSFFEEHKMREPQPDLIGQMEFPSPVPGFRLPRKIDVQFIQAEYDQFVTKIEGEITEEEIAKYYEENKDPRFIKADTGLIDDPPASLETDTPSAQESGASVGEAPNAEAEQATETAVPATGVDGNHDSAATPPESEPPSSNGAPGDADSNTPPAPPAAAEGQPPTATSEDDLEPNTDDQSSQGSQRGVFHLAAYLQESQDTAENSDSPTGVPSPETTPPADASAAAGETQSAENGAAVGQPDSSVPADNSAATPAESSAAPATTTGVEAAESAATPAVGADEPKEFQPLDEVRDEIRRTLAVERASQQLNDLMSQLYSQVNAEFTKYFGVRLQAETEGREVPPPPAELTDLAPLSAKYGLKHGTTGPMSWLEMRKTPVGASGEIESRTELYRILFASDDLELYQPISTQDVDANRYLAMKMSDVPGRIPELAEVRDEVIRAWKLRKAADLAQKRAEELAKQAQEANSSLTDVLADQQGIEVIRTDPFSRYTGGEVFFAAGSRQQQPFRLSEPGGIVAAGPEFMDEVFGLKQGEVGAVLNHDHSIAYVVRVVEHQFSPDELRTAYLGEANNWPGINIMTSDHMQLATQLLAADIFQSRGLKWERPADQPEEAATAEEEQ
jgi:hypothetical protein